MQGGLQRKQPAPNNMHWSKGSRSRTVRDVKCAAPLQSQRHINRVGQHIQQPAHTDSQSVWRSQTEQLGPVWMWGETADRKRCGDIGKKWGTKRRCLDVTCWSTWPPLLKRVSEQTHSCNHFLHDKHIATHTKHHYVRTIAIHVQCKLTSVVWITIQCLYNNVYIDMDR